MEDVVQESKSNGNCMRHNAVMELRFPIMRMFGQRRLGAHANDPKREENSCQNVLNGNKSW